VRHQVLGFKVNCCYLKLAARWLVLNPRVIKTSLYADCWLFTTTVCTFYHAFRRLLLGKPTFSHTVDPTCCSECDRSHTQARSVLVQRFKQTAVRDGRKSIGLHGVVTVRSDGSTEPTAGPIRAPSCRDLSRMNLFCNTTSLCGTLIQRMSHPKSVHCRVHTSHYLTTSWSGWIQPTSSQPEVHSNINLPPIYNCYQSDLCNQKYASISSIRTCYTPLAFFSLLDIPNGCSYRASLFISSG
jgi:hypothetical protein